MRYLSSGVPHTNRRRGMILLVVMAMLALFASVGLGFVFYADSEAVAAQMHSRSVAPEQPDIDTELMAAYFLNNLLYPSDNVDSAMRGWDLARSVYGYNPAVLNFTPFNGTGRSSLSYPVAFGVTPYDNFNLINYTLYDGPANPNDPYLKVPRTPEYYGKTGDANYRYVGGANPPWTAFDTNNLFLAQMTADGTVLMPSFHRPWNGAGDVNSAKYMTLRPHGSWHPGFDPAVTGFPFGLPDSDAGGNDVKNLDFGSGSLIGGVYYPNDSRWLDLGAPVMSSPSGKRFKPLFAPLVIDLDNRLHLGVHGSRVVPGGTGVSNQGYGASEVNLSRLANLNAAELQSLYNLRYGGTTGTAASLAMGVPDRFRPTTHYSSFSKVDSNGYDSISGVSTAPFFTGFTTVSTNAVAAAATSMTVANFKGVGNGGFPYAIQLGMSLTIDVGAMSEIVVVTSVTPATNSFTAVFTMPHAVGAMVAYQPLFAFPNYPPTAWNSPPNGSTGWNNANALEMTNNPLAYNFFNPIGPNIGSLPISNQEALLRHRGTNAPAFTSELFRRMPLTFSNVRARNMATLASWHLDRIGGAPVIPYDPTTAGHFQYVPAVGYPRSIPFIPPNPGLPIPAPAANSEYTADWRSNLGASLKVNLNRPLADYPLPTLVPNAAEPLSRIIDTTNASILASYTAALTQRQQFALDIYNALIRVTGAQNPRDPAVTVIVASGDYQAARWLAQLAVNIVDYIDTDDYVTAWNWHGTEFVYGTELPRLVLNEAYAQNDNDANTVNLGTMTATTSRLNVWVELHNPFVATPATSLYPLDGGSAKLQIGANPVYQVVVCQSNAALTTAMRDPANNVGDPIPANVLSTSSNWGATPVQHEVLPANGAASGPSALPNNNQGYYVLGPSTTLLPARDPNLPATSASPQMSVARGPDDAAIPVTVLLRRLANPHLPPQPNAALPLYNPYITVDYLNNIPTHENRLYNSAMMLTPANVDTFQAYGRSQPFAAHASQVAAQVGNIPGTIAQTSFFRFNTNASTPFTWLTHLDRPLVNQLELLHVSGFKPHELTQQFITAGGRFQHYAPWADQTALLYRALEVLATPNYMAGNVLGGRQPGRINLNTVTEEEVFQALCDPQDAVQLYSAFTTADVKTTFNRLIVSRNPLPTATHPMQPNSEGDPFRSFADGNMAKTWFRADALGPIFQPASLGANAHIYAKTSLLQKVFNNVTTTSNVFAVWWTVGYFEVVDETVRPARLGAEIGRDENRHIRHRFFAIVDRSAMQLFDRVSTASVGPNPMCPPNPAWNNATNYVLNDVVNHSGFIYQCIQPNTNTGPPNTNFWIQITATATMGFNAFNPLTDKTASNIPFAIQPGMLLEIDTGAAAEVVAVQTVLGNTFTANFARSHAAGVPIICRGNPGPRANYNPRRDNNVVLHMNVIK